MCNIFNSGLRRQSLHQAENNSFLFPFQRHGGENVRAPLARYSFRNSREVSLEQNFFLFAIGIIVENFKNNLPYLDEPLLKDLQFFREGSV